MGNLTSDHLYTLQVHSKSQFWNLITFFPTIAPNVFALEGAWIKKQAALMSGAFMLWAAETFAVYFVTIALLAESWPRFMALWLLPSILSVDMILTMNVLQHDGCLPIQLGLNKGIDMEINSARNFVGPVINLLTCNNGYHTIHHMHSRMHCSQYPKLHQLLVVPRMDPRLDERDILRYLWRTFFWPAKLPPHREHYRRASAKGA